MIFVIAAVKLFDQGLDGGVIIERVQGVGIDARVGGQIDIKPTTGCAIAGVPTNDLSPGSLHTFFAGKDSE